MKKFIVPSLLAILCSACASTSDNNGIPSGYTVNKLNDNAAEPTYVFLRPDDGAKIYFSDLKEEEPANEVATLFENGCKGSAQGDEKKAFVNDCEVDNEKGDMYIYTFSKNTRVLLANDKVSKDDIETIMYKFKPTDFAN